MCILEQIGTGMARCHTVKPRLALHIADKVSDMVNIDKFMKKY